MFEFGEMFAGGFPEPVGNGRVAPEEKNGQAAGSQFRVWGETGDQVLLCLRNIEPRRGKWTLPAGFMELGETTSEGAHRETIEEAGAQIELGELFTLMNVARVGQVHMYYRARLISDHFDPGFETIEARLFTEDQIPWDEIAFRTVRETLECYFADRRQGRFGFHTIDID